MYKRVALLLIGALLVSAAAWYPRYLEALRIGGGYGESVDGGADLDSDGTLRTNGDLVVDGSATTGGVLNVNGGQIGSSETSVTISPAGSGFLTVASGTTQLQNSGGRLWFINPTGSTAHFRFYMPDSAGNSQDYGSIWCNAADATDGSEDGVFKFSLIRNGVYDYDVFSVTEQGNGRFDGDLTLDGGDATLGINGTTRGLITLANGTSGAAPGTIKLYSSNGTVWYLFVEDDGTLRIHNALPDGDTVGTVVGLQY